MAVTAATTMSYQSVDAPVMTLTSDNFDGTVEIDLEAPRSVEGWGVYARAAALAITDALPPTPRGLRGHVAGRLPGSGLSSSASVTLAYLTAIADVNEVSLPPVAMAQMALSAERDFVGVKVGILDPAAIVGSKRDHLLWIDSRDIRFEPVALGEKAPPWQILVAYSGVRRNLLGTPYNDRVEECHGAARKLADWSGATDVRGLHDFSDEVYETFRYRLRDSEAKRARHFFSERARVRAGVERWREGDIEGFGELMNASCHSSIENWESGSPELIELQRTLERTAGVYGSRFSGAGFGGSVVALVEDADAVARVLPVEAFRVESDDGVRIL